MVRKHWIQWIAIISFCSHIYASDAQMIAPALNGGIGFISTQAAKPYGQGYLGINFNLIYNVVKMENSNDQENLLVGVSSFTYNLSDDMGFSAALYAIGQSFLYKDVGIPDKLESGFGHSELAFKYHLSMGFRKFDLASRMAIFIPMGADFTIHPSYPYDTNVYCLELSGLQSYKISRIFTLHLNEGYRWRGLRADYVSKDDLWLTDFCVAYKVKRNVMGFSELSSAIELDDKIQPVRDRFVYLQGFRYHTPWGVHVNLAGSFRLNKKRLDGTVKRAENWRIMFGLSIGTQTYRPDNDGDGVFNNDDLEPTTPSGWPVDSKGRSLDSDQDGVADGMDQEPQTREGAVVDRLGQSIDSDKDGVPDGIDQEPNTVTGAIVNKSGVAIDSDNDGVPDGIDIEPSTPKGMLVDSKGKSLLQMEIDLLTKGYIRVYKIYFDIGKHTIKPESFVVLNEIGKLLERHADLKIQIEGHTDAVGSDKFNEQLSINRANAVKNYLMTRFTDIHPEHLTTKGFGRSKPITDNQTEEGKTLNRRVEFRVIE